MVVLNREMKEEKMEQFEEVIRNGQSIGTLWCDGEMDWSVVCCMENLSSCESREEAIVLIEEEAYNQGVLTL